MSVSDFFTKMAHPPDAEQLIGPGKGPGVSDAQTRIAIESRSEFNAKVAAELTLKMDRQGDLLTEIRDYLRGATSLGEDAPITRYIGGRLDSTNPTLREQLELPRLKGAVWALRRIYAIGKDPANSNAPVSPQCTLNAPGLIPFDLPLYVYNDAGTQITRAPYNANFDIPLLDPFFPIQLDLAGAGPVLVFALFTFYPVH